MNASLERQSPPRARISLSSPQLPVGLHTVVSPAPAAPEHLDPDSHTLLQQVLDQCRRSADPMPVGQIAAEVQAPPGPICVAVSDLLHDGILCANDPQSRRSAPRHLILERVRNHLEQNRQVETAKMVVLGEPEETRAFTAHLDDRVAVSADVESTVSRLDSDLYLLVMAVHHPQALEQRWPDLMRETDAAVLLVRSDRLSDAHTSAQLLESRELPFLIVVHLADDAIDLDAEQVVDELGVDVTAPVVMVDVHSPTAPVTVLRDLCTWAAHEDGVKA